MKRVRSALALVISVSMALLVPGGSAWAQVAQTVSGAQSASAGGSAAAAGAMNRGASVAPVNLAPALTLTALTPVFSAPSAIMPAASVPLSAAALAGSALPAAAANASPVPAARAVAEIPAASVKIDAEAASAPSSVHGAAAPANAPVLTAAPAASALEGARRELPDFSKMSSGDVRGAAASDFLSRVGELFRPAPALNAAPLAAAMDGARGETASPLARYQASPSNSPAASPVEQAIMPRSARSTLSARSAVVPLAAVAATLTMGAAGGFVFAAPLLTLPLVFISLVLHELGHAKMAKALGDPTATKEGRASFNPLTWHKHVDPMMTIVLPIITYVTSGLVFGVAKPVPIGWRYFKKHPARDRALVAVAGPAVNIALAALGALAYAGAVAAGLGPIVLGVLTSFVFINAALALFNLMPIPPLDGGHILLAAMPKRVADAIDGIYWKIGLLGMIPILVIAVAGGGAIMAAAAGLTHLLIGVSFAVTGVQLAGAALPAIAALGMAIGSLRTPGVAQLAAGAPPSGPAVPGAAEGADAGRPVDLVVMFSPHKSIAKDLHLTTADSRAGNYVQVYEGLQRGLLAELNAVGLSPETLAAYDASPIASYRRINAATIRVDASKADAFEAALIAAGHKVYPNDRRKIVIPRPIVPEDADPSSRNPITMAENLKITKADAVHAILTKRFGAPDMNPWQKAARAVKRAFGVEDAPQPLIAVVDSGADVAHPLLKRVKAVVNETAGENVDDIGHGSWVTSMVLNYAPWAKNLTHYKTFQGGGANLDDILKSLTAAANDGNLVISNSWGSDDGDPTSPDSVLVQKLASEGHVLVFAAGNAGPGANTIGSPAIVQFKDPTTGAIRVVAVAATDRNKKIASFSSRGPGSPKTIGQTGFAHRPDLAALGSNTEGAWPAALGDADRTDPVLGAIKAISGTSMSTPSVAGAIALLLIAFGVTEKGAKLDAVVNAVMATLEKTGKNGVDDEGEGFINIEAAYESLYKQFNPSGIPPTAIARYRAAVSDEKSMREYLDPLSEANRAAGHPDDATVRMVMSDMARTDSVKAALEAEYPGIGHSASGWVSRAWAWLTGRAPTSPAVREYRFLSTKVLDNAEASARFMSNIGQLAPGVREEMLEYYYHTMAPEYDADAASLADLVRNNPGIAYESAGFFGRLALRLTGRGPK